MELRMKRIQAKAADGEENVSGKRRSIVLAAMELFARYGYKKTSIDEIAEAAGVAKRTVYLNFENKAAVFVAMLEYFRDQVLERCEAAERSEGSAVERLTAMLDAYYGPGFEMYSKTEYSRELSEASMELAQARIVDFTAEYEARVVRFVRRLKDEGEIGGPPPGLTVPQIVHMLVRGAEAAKHEPGVRGDAKAYAASLRGLATMAIAAMRK
jgi:AcrR family transcriptional regulator